MNPPRREAVRIVHTHMNIRRVVQRNPVEHQPIRMTGVDHRRCKVALILRLSLARHLPPAIVLAQNLRVSPSIYHPISHDARVLRIMDRNQRPASTHSRLRRRRNRAAHTRLHARTLQLIQSSIARTKQRNPFVDHQRHTGSHLQRPRKKRVIPARRFQLHRTPRRTPVQSRLDARRIQLTLIRGVQLLADRSKSRWKLNTGCRNLRLSDRARILRRCPPRRRDDSNQKNNPYPTHHSL